MTSVRRMVLLMSLALASVVGCGASEIGEECDTAGSTDDCVDGAVCTNEEAAINRCRQVCDETSECPTLHSCNGVSGTSIKSCQPD